MLDMDHVRERTEELIGDTLEIAPIEKGFSSELKFKVTTARNVYLLRLSPSDSSARKRQEFNLMQKLNHAGVRCNIPIEMSEDEEQETVYTIYSYLPGSDAEGHIAALPEATQYEIGVEAGKDLRLINGLTRPTSDWKDRKWKKHQRYVSQYFKQDYRFRNDERILRFVESHYDPSEAEVDHFQHDDFHLGNVIINDHRYGGVLDFNRYDWGDPLHEFVKLEWFTWPVSEAFANGQVAGYFRKERITDDECLQISVYLAMSIRSTIVWTRGKHSQVWKETEIRMQSVLDHYSYFESVHPNWAI